MSECDGRIPKITVQNGFRPDSYLVSWDIAEDNLAAYHAHIYRSFDASAWTRLTKEPLQYSTWYEDDVVLPRNTDNIYYRVVLTPDKEGYDKSELVYSPIGGLYGHLTQFEQAVARKIINDSLTTLSSGRMGQRAYLLRPLIKGKRCPDCQNVVIGDGSQTSVCPTCYGTGIVGGYRNPVETWVRRQTSRQIQLADGIGGAGTDDRETAQFQMLPFPVPRTHDMLVIPATSERYVVGMIDLKLFRAVVPVNAIVRAVQIRKGDIRWRLQVSQ